MNENKCIFCSVINGELPSYKIWEDNDSIAVLDLCPNTKGQTLVLSKNHLPSYPFDIDDKEYLRALKSAKTVGKILEQKLNVKRVALVIEGMGIDHLHIKLYPLHGLDTTFQETWTNETAYFDNYKGYISTLMGNRAEEKELLEIQKLITNN